ncbi:hypothetical protein C8F04DRAFT_1196680 [Mycena alexandri]|uniref:Uncharacterized protein n=1 Tax=Mycena alexandri TaxID=1745969 RepID=A0AAD6WPK7_9AGAR|nr:hypothetical protein C8F04DRAFT_1196680 [Mycena alexandri]
MEYAPLEDFVDSAQPTLSKRQASAPTRDRSDGKFDLFSYKSLETEVQATLYSRGALETLWVTAFGEVEYSKRGPSAFIKFRCPRDVNCGIKRVYMEQIAQLHSLLSMENSELGGVVVSSWFEGVEGGVSVADDCFYISVDDIDQPEWYWNALNPGDLLGVWVNILRRDCVRSTGVLCREYKLNSLYFETVLPTTPRGQGFAYNCDSKPLNIPNLTPPIMLARMLAYESGTVALAEYDRDFVAVRQASLDGGSLFTFKSVPGREQGDDFGTKGALQNYIGSVFGEVGDVYSMSDGLCVLRIKIPSNASCALSDLWEKQWDVLGDIVAKDESDICYFSRASLRPGHLFCAHSVVPRHAAAVDFEQYYHMELRGLEAKRVGYFPNRGTDYTCDNNDRTPFRRCVQFLSTTMLQKIREYPPGSLALGKYQQHFFAVREESDGRECVYRFKGSRDVLVDPSSERRWPQPRHSALAYGEIEKVFRMHEEGEYCVLLTCPRNATCDAVNMFRKQLWSLRRILEIDTLECPGQVVVSWFDRAREDPQMRVRTGSFYVVLRADTEEEAAEYEDMLISNDPVGKLLECRVRFERSQVETGDGVLKRIFGLVLTSTWVGIRNESSPKHRASSGLWLYSDEGHRNTEETPLMLLLQHLEDAGRMALGTVEYGVDFAAVREGSYPGGSEFFFAEDKIVSALSEIQEGLGLRINIIVGEIEKISGVTTCSLGPACDVLCVKIRPPSNSNCEGYKAYFKQLRQLHNILETDFTNGSTQPVGDSWFDASRDFEGWGPQQDCFYVLVRDTRDDRTERVVSLVAGTCVAFCGTMSRLDEEVENTRNYYLWALEFLPGEFPTQGEAGILHYNISAFVYLVAFSITSVHRRDAAVELVRMFDRSYGMSPLLAKIQAIGGGSLAYARYEDDFYATRDASCQEDDFYTFKSIKERWDPGSERREECLAFFPVLFGEILEVYEISTQAADQIEILLGCPRGATCRAREVFMKQVATLEHILAIDNIEFVAHRASLAGSDRLFLVRGCNGPRESEICIPGKRIMPILTVYGVIHPRMSGFLSCADPKTHGAAETSVHGCECKGTAAVVHDKTRPLKSQLNIHWQAYEMWAVCLQIQKPERLARVGPGYSCDLDSEGTCPFCGEVRESNTSEFRLNFELCSNWSEKEDSGHCRGTRATQIMTPEPCLALVSYVDIGQARFGNSGRIWPGQAQSGLETSHTLPQRF